MTPDERARLIARYAQGPDRLEAALARTPAAALQWRPGPGKWSVHEVVIHCADSECNAHMRLRYLVADPQPLIIGYDEAAWAITLHYHALPLAPALAAIRAVRTNTLPLLHRLTDADWQKPGRHTQRDRYGVEVWLQDYAEHLEIHERQIDRNLAAFTAQGGR